MRETYKRRRDVLVESFSAPAGMCRHRAPRCLPGRRSRSRLPARQRGVFQAAGREGDIAVSPGIGFGEYGEGFVRIALVENEQRIRQAARNVRRFLDTAPEQLHNVVPLATGADRPRIKWLSRSE